MTISEELKNNLIADVLNILCLPWISKDEETYLKRAFEITIATHLKEFNLDNQNIGKKVLVFSSNEHMSSEIIRTIQARTGKLDLIVVDNMNSPFEQRTIEAPVMFPIKNIEIPALGTISIKKESKEPWYKNFDKKRGKK